MSTRPLSCTNLCQIIDRLEVGVIVLDQNQHVVHWNRWIALRSGLQAEQTISRPLHDVFPEVAGSRLTNAVEHAIRDGLPSLLSPALHGTLLPLFQKPDDRHQQRRMQQLTHVLPLRDPTSQGACIIQVSDVTANISRERLLRQQAETLKGSTTEDPVTGVPNRRRFDEMQAEEFRKAQLQGTPLTLMIADIDHFAQYNTHYGRDLGDRTLADVARVLSNALRPAQDLICRYGGEEFAILMPGTDSETAGHLAEQLRLAIRSRDIRHDASPDGHSLTVSIGLASLTPDPQADIHTLVSSADVALYQAKHEGRNRSVLFALDSGQFKTCG